VGLIVQNLIARLGSQFLVNASLLTFSWFLFTEINEEDKTLYLVAVFDYITEVGLGTNWKL
jgi:hypothetical protein